MCGVSVVTVTVLIPAETAVPIAAIDTAFPFELARPLTPTHIQLDILVPMSVLALWDVQAGDCATPVDAYELILAEGTTTPVTLEFQIRGFEVLGIVELVCFLA
ncbi:hypothetical protein [Halorubrum sp. AS12]|uniref:hypothetical protein n=1 Tax=Halorubrum sp. AS12 TaxID=3409687 RepID=UPI003DA6E767